MPYSELDEQFLVPETKEGIRSRFEDIVPGSSDKGVVLWRYLDLAKLIALISERKLYLTRTDAVKDKHEGSVTNPMIRARKEQFEGKSFNPVTLSNWLKHLKENTFISCWCMLPSESEAMWKLYCGEKHGVAITATYRDIEAALPDSSYKMAPVQYLNYQNDRFPWDNYYYPFFHKRDAFAHESEVRIVRIATDQYDDGSRPASFSDPPTDAQRQQLEKERQQKAQLRAERGMSIPIELDVINTIREIVVHPDAPDWYSAVVKEVVNKFIPELGQRVRWSSMKGEPLF